MDRDKLERRASIVASSYIKRWLEQHYDSLMRSSAAQKVMQSGAPTRYGIEAALYALLAYGDQRWPANTPLQSLAREIAMDAPAEISKRLVNGFREEVVGSTHQQKPEEQQSVEEVLLQLDDETLGTILTWLAEQSPEDRARIRSRICRLSDEQLRRVARLSRDDLDILLEDDPSDHDRHVASSSGAAKSPSRLSQAIREELEAAHRRADEKFAERRNRRR